MIFEVLETFGWTWRDWQRTPEEIQLLSMGYIRRKAHDYEAEMKKVEARSKWQR